MTPVPCIILLKTFMQYWYNYAIWIVLAFTFTNFSSHIFTIEVYTVWMCQVLFYTIHLFYKWEFLKSFLFLQVHCGFSYSSSYFFGTYVFVFYIYFWINWFTEVTCNCIGYITLFVQYFSLNFLVIYCLFRKKIVLHKVPINLSIVHVHSLFAQKLPWCAVSS